MKIKVRKQIENVETCKDPYTGKTFKNTTVSENGFVEEMEINPVEITSFSSEKSIRLIGIDKKLYPLTLKSWKETKKQLERTDVLERFNLEKAN